MNNYEINAFVGPMYSGKSEALLKVMLRAQYAGQEVRGISPRNNEREETMKSRAGSEWSSELTIISTNLSRVALEKSVKVVGIDEAFMFEDESDDVVDRMQAWVDSGITVYVATLDKKGDGVEFPIMSALRETGAYIEQQTAVCFDSCCSRDARFSAMYSKTTGMRLRKMPELSVGGIASEGSEVAEDIVYQAHCRLHFQSREHLND